MNRKKTQVNEVISRREKWNHHMKACVYLRRCCLRLCSVLHPECSCRTPVHREASLRGVWGHRLIACDMLTWLLWLTQPRTFSQRQSDQWWTLSELSHSGHIHLPEKTLQMFPSPQPVVWFCRTMAAWCMLFICSRTPRLYNEPDRTHSSVILHCWGQYVVSAQAHNKSLVH